MASVDQLIRRHRLDQISNGSAAAAMVVALGLEFVAGRITHHQLVEALVAADLLSHQAATRLASSYVTALRAAHGVGGTISAPPFDAGASLGRAVGLLRDLDQARDRVIDRSPELRQAMERFGRGHRPAVGVELAEVMDRADVRTVRDWDTEYRQVIEQFGVTADRHAKNAGRDTVADSAAASGRKWRRVSDGNPCSFCAMMIARGPVYTAEDAAAVVVGRRRTVARGGITVHIGQPRRRGSRPLGSKYHDGCGCTVVEVIGTWTPTAEEQGYIDLYKDATAALAAEGVPATAKAVTQKMRELGDGRINDAWRPSTHAAKVRSAAAAAEPRITKTMTTLAQKHGLDTPGLENRLKTRESLARKIASDAADKGVSLAESAGKVSDAVRYTMTAGEAEYAAATKSVLTDLQAAGWQARVKNYWVSPSNPYQGVNVALTSPEGQLIELQFHTPTSYAVKDGAMHDLYEQWRTSKSPTERTRLAKQMADLARTIPVPPGVEQVH